MIHSLIRSSRSFNRAVLSAVIGLFSAHAADACDICSGGPIPPLREGAEAGVAVMLGFVAFVLVSIVGFGSFYFVRARRIARVTDRSSD